MKVTSVSRYAVYVRGEREPYSSDPRECVVDCIGKYVSIEFSDGTSITDDDCGRFSVGESVELDAGYPRSVPVAAGDYLAFGDELLPIETRPSRGMRRAVVATIPEAAS